MRLVAITGVLLGDAGALVALRPARDAVAATVARPRAAVAEHGADGALLPVVGAAAWLAAAWLAVGLAAALAARLPGAAGRLAGVVAGRLLPRALLSLVSGSAGLGLLLAPAAGATPAGAPSGDRPPPAWPVTATASVPESGPVSHATPPAPSWPTGGPAHTTPAHADRPTAATVTVRPGDSLWAIAGRRLGPAATPQRIAGEWPRWFAANRSAIGADPDVLQPGQTLRAPADHRPSDPSAPEAKP